MDTAGHCTASAVGEESKRSPRVAAAAALTEFDQRDSAWTSPSEIARELHLYPILHAPYACRPDAHS